ncbi:cell division protein FtsQ/DivIB [Thiopseudomonas alkaliphila]|uniref:cell division protein FtsQ/DivIB n=1 Tax=Thiopseudomonas alkaliphila TaxID=1697053 RepID=UPI00069E6868|nr:cell division protein FtsQ/DivIB [Thiopseudomonas alkaliphila]
MNHRTKVTANRRGATPLYTSAAPPSKKLSFKLSSTVVDLLVRIFKTLVVVVVLLALYQGALILKEKYIVPIQHVRVHGNLDYVSQKAVEERLAPYLSSNFFELDLQAITDVIDDMPWVERAVVSRVWPDTVLIEMQEQVPVARWGEKALINHKGQTFQPLEMESYQKLPLLSGPNRSTKQVMDNYELINGLLSKINQSVSRIEMRERGSWFIVTNTGLEIELGRDQTEEKVKRFIYFYQTELNDTSDDVARVDLRYPKGIAVTKKSTSVSDI